MRRRRRRVVLGACDGVVTVRGITACWPPPYSLLEPLHPGGTTDDVRVKHDSHHFRLPSDALVVQALERVHLNGA
jgi:tRNA A37 threonylcarbamoyladenosine synthetase subunit TsaC/SUA5/YrdC